MGRNRLRPLAALVALGLATTTTRVHAQGTPVPPPPPPPSAPAAPAPSAPATAPVNPAAELAAGDKAAKAKDYAGALAHYQASAQASPSMRAQLGAADALYQLGKVGEAYDAYQDAQATYATKLAGGDKTLVASRLRELASKTGALSVHVEDSGADVALDGRSIGTSPIAAIVRLPVGPHEVRVVKAGFVPFATSAEVPADGKAVVDVTPLAPVPTRGHVIVHAPGSEPLRVVIDGVDLGSTPWEGDLPAGQHEIAGRSSTQAATSQTINLAVGDRLAVDLVTSATAAHLQVRTSDGKGKIYVDGVPKGEGEFAGDVAPGAHNVVVEREGYERFEKTVTLGERETWAETVTLNAPRSATGPVAAPERAFEGVYGGFGFTGLFGVGGQGTDLDTNCDGLGASSCSTGQPIGGGAFGYVGWTWNPVGFELMLGGSADTLQETAHFTTSAGSATSPIALPPRDETFTFARVGGIAALRVRASTQGPILRGTIAGGVGLTYKRIFMKRDTMTTDGSARVDVYSPTEAHDVSYVSPALTVEGAIQLRITPTIAISVGGLMWADNASISGTNSTPPAPGRVVGLGNGTLPPQPIATPAYHLATGPQIFLGPFVGMQFGP